VQYNYRIRRLRLSRLLLGQAARHPSPRIIRTLGHMQTVPPFNTIEEQHQEIVRVARGVLDGTIEIAAGAREMDRVPFRSHSKLKDKDDDFLAFVGINLVTGHIPLGDVRSKWDPQVLRDKDRELARLEESLRDRALRACRNLIAKYGNGA